MSEQTEQRDVPEEDVQSDSSTQQRPTELGGPKGPEPTRYGDWECKGRCSDF